MCTWELHIQELELCSSPHNPFLSLNLVQGSNCAISFNYFHMLNIPANYSFMPNDLRRRFLQCSKLFAHMATENYCRSHQLHVFPVNSCNSLLTSYLSSLIIATINNYSAQTQHTYSTGFLKVHGGVKWGRKQLLYTDHMVALSSH